MGQSSDAYNKKDSDIRFAPASALSNYYTKPQSDSRFAPAPALTSINNTISSMQGTIGSMQDSLTSINNTIGGLQSVYDSRYASASALSNLNNTIGGLKGVFDTQYAPAASALTSINNTISSMQGTIGSMQDSLTSINNTIGGLQSVYDGRYASASALTSINNTIGGLQSVYDSRYVQGSMINDMLSKGWLLDKNVSSLTNFYNKKDIDNKFAPASNSMNNINSTLSNNIAELKFMLAKERLSAPAYNSCMSSNTLNINGNVDATKNVLGTAFVTCDTKNIWTMTFDFKRLTRGTGMINIIQKYTSAPRNNFDCDQRTPVIAVTNGEAIGFRYSYGNSSNDAQCGMGIPNANLPWDNDWHNIIWQQNGRNIQIYLDGRSVVNHTLPADPVPFDPTRNLTLGADNFISIKNFNYIPAYLLTANEIGAIAFNRNF
jgi:uncharacterized protein YukE